MLAHARALLTSGEASATEYIDADLRDTGTILGQAGQLLDFTKPVAVTLVSVLHAIPDADEPHAIGAGSWTPSRPAATSPSRMPGRTSSVRKPGRALRASRTG